MASAYVFIPLNSRGMSAELAVMSGALTGIALNPMGMSVG